MLTSLTIKNFQSHKDSTLQFSPNVNVILGHNDSGKSAIFRAIDFVVFNSLSGDSFVRHGEKKM